MLNHARTLLMNVSGNTGYNPEYIAEEIVDPNFSALSLPYYLISVRTTLFGTDPDRNMLNWRCRQLLAVTHASPLAEYLLTFDPRITYDFSETLSSIESQFGVNVAKVAGPSDARCSIFGSPSAIDAVGRMAERYTVTTASGSIYVATQSSNTTRVYDFSDGTAPLGASGRFVRLSTALDGQEWVISTLDKPRRALPVCIASAALIGEPHIDALFGVTNAEPYKTFRALWQRKRELPLRISALVCAMTYRAEEIRVGG